MSAVRHLPVSLRAICGGPLRVVQPTLRGSSDLAASFASVPLSSFFPFFSAFGESGLHGLRRVEVGSVPSLRVIGRWSLFWISDCGMSKEIHSQGKIPFSWEKKPGVSKAARPPEHHHLPPRKLPPPPCPPAMAARLSSVHDSQIPRVRLSRSSSRKGTKKVIMNDPFLIAYKEVTKSEYKNDKGLIRSEKGDRGLGALRNISMFSCKVQSSCIVEENSVIRFSQLPISRSYRNGGHN
ncbi:hypothetical protein STAS_13891 [Striga asiatica]|uniref:Uncharacterized protein n=1 Tax=Striga asiatica TaxID=4170 RepID=A0A5A7PZD9_STRAF|nr:hypothetical protein STAS_13891 [Striga asiatica]